MKLHKCPYEKACKCAMIEPCSECEVFAEHNETMYLEKDYENILQKSKSQSMDIMGLSEMCDRLEKENKDILKKFADKSVSAMNLYKICDELEKENRLLGMTLTTLLDNYTVLDEDERNLIKECFKLK